MIKIIKEGKLTKYTATCSCGCEFEYDSSDVQIDYSILLTTYPGQYNTYVICPCCGRHIHHGAVFENTFPIYYNQTNKYDTLDCDKCINKPDPTKPIQAGDTPCTWCRKNQPYCTSSIYSTNEDSYKWYKQVDVKRDPFLEDLDDPHR